MTPVRHICLTRPRQVNSTDFRAQFDEFINLVREQPIEVLRGGKRIGVFLSPEEYEHLERLEDLYDAVRAKAAEAGGNWIGHDEAIRILTKQISRTS